MRHQLRFKNCAECPYSVIENLKVYCVYIKNKKQFCGILEDVITDNIILENCPFK